MFLQLLLGAGVASVSIAMLAAFIGVAIFVLRRSARWIGDPPPIRNTIIALTAVRAMIVLRMGGGSPIQRAERRNTKIATPINAANIAIETEATPAPSRSCKNMDWPLL